MKQINFIYYLIISTIIISCAQPVSPTGGPTDKTAPIIIKQYPLQNATNQFPKKIIIEFDENIQLNNALQNVIISPNPGKTKINHTNRSVEININTDSLIPNTTYTINLNETISDLNEGNKGVYEALQFSTGNKIDSNSIVGSIVTTHVPKIINYKSICFNTEEKINKTIYRNKFINNIFKISGLDSAEKNIVSYNDVNNNNIPDNGESISYLKNIKPSKDTIYMTMYQTGKKTIDIYQKDSIHYLSGLNISLQEKIILTNPQLYSYKDTLAIPSNIIKTIINLIPNNYYTKPSILSEIKNTPVQYNIYSTILDSSRSINIEFNIPILKIDTSAIHIINTGDTNNIIKYHSDIINTNTIKITCFDNINPIKLIIDKNAITTKESNYKNIITTNIENTYNNGSLELINNSDTLKHMIISGNNKIINITLNKKSSKSIYVPRGTYNINYYNDDDTDYHITPPNIDRQYEGEKIGQIKNIIVKPNYINEIRF